MSAITLCKQIYRGAIRMSLIILIMGSPLLAAPTISGLSGSIVDDSTVTITSSSSSFGTGPSSVEWLGGKSGAIESGTPGSKFSKTNWDGANPWPENYPVYSSSQAHSGSKSIYCNPTSSSWNSILDYQLPSPVTSSGSLFVSTWYRITSSGSGQWKMNRFTTNNTIVDGTNQLVLFSWTDGTQVCVDPNVVSYTGISPSPIATQNTWMRIDQYIKAGTSSGSYTLTKYVPGSTKQSATISSYPTHRSGGSWNYIIWQNYAGNGLSEAKIYIDDIYISNGSQARVEIGDKSTYTSCTHLEIQPTSSWSPSSISFKVNKGSFGSSDAAYLFVVDSSGNASAGYPITFASSYASGSDVNAPAKPTGITLTIQ